MKAFPYSIDNGVSVKGEKGMDLRDYFAAKSIQTAFKMIKHDLDETIPEGYEWDDQEDYEEIANRAYRIADAMMKAREK